MKKTVRKSRGGRCLLVRKKTIATLADTARLQKGERSKQERGKKAWQHGESAQTGAKDG